MEMIAKNNDRPHIKYKLKDLTAKEKAAALALGVGGSAGSYLAGNQIGKKIAGAKIGKSGVAKIVGGLAATGGAIYGANKLGDKVKERKAKNESVLELRNFILENADILENTISANIGVGYPVIPGGSMKKFSGTRDGEYEGDADDKGSAEDDDDDKVAPSDVDEFDVDDTEDTENDERGDLTRNESLRNFITNSYLNEMAGVITASVIGIGALIAGIVKFKKRMSDIKMLQADAQGKRIYKKWSDLVDQAGELEDTITDLDRELKSSKDTTKYGIPEDIELKIAKVNKRLAIVSSSIDAAQKQMELKIKELNKRKSLGEMVLPKGGTAAARKFFSSTGLTGSNIRAVSKGVGDYGKASKNPLEKLSGHIVSKLGKKPKIVKGTRNYLYNSNRIGDVADKLVGKVIK